VVPWDKIYSADASSSFTLLGNMEDRSATVSAPSLDFNPNVSHINCDDSVVHQDSRGTIRHLLLHNSPMLFPFFKKGMVTWKPIENTLLSQAPSGSSFMRTQTLQELRLFWDNVRGMYKQDYKKKHKYALKRKSRLSHKRSDREES